jgi:hypothetical protein
MAGILTDGQNPNRWPKSQRMVRIKEKNRITIRVPASRKDAKANRERIGFEKEGLDPMKIKGF